MATRLATTGAVALLALASGCRKAPSEAMARSTAGEAAVTPPGEATGAIAPGSEHGSAATTGVHGTRKMKGMDIPVFVDGQQVAVLRYGDVPAMANVGTASAPAFRLSDYLAALGVNVDKVRAAHFMSSHHTLGQLLGRELRAEKARFRVQFASGDSGVPQARWDTVGLADSYNVHEIWKVFVYVDKPAPAIDKERQCYLEKDGTCRAEAPYGDGKAIKGTRIYLDGRMVGFVKRRLVTEDIKSGVRPSGEVEYSLSGFIKTLGVDPASLTAMDLVAGDDIIARADSALVRDVGAKLSFVLPAHQHGKVMVHVPVALQSKDAVPPPTERDAYVSAVKLHSKTPGDTARPLSAISERTDLSVKLALATERQEAEGQN